MTSVARSTWLQELKVRLDALLRSVDRATWLRNDPVQFVHRYADPLDQEIVGLLSASLAFGNVTVVRRNIAVVLDELGERPSVTLATMGARALHKRLRTFRHRLYQGQHVAALLHRAGELSRASGSIGTYIERQRALRSSFRFALADFADVVRGESPDAAMAHLVSDMRRGSANKRMMLFSRWMVRPRDGVDLGLWNIEPSELVIPLDTHVQRIAHQLELTDRRTASWSTAEDITSTLRQFDARDPVKYDFAICHLGISKACPSRRQPSICDTCELRSVCRAWR